MTVIDFPDELTAMTNTIREMYHEGMVREIVFFAPNAVNPDVFHFHASGGIKLSDVLMAKQYLTQLANRLSEIAAEKPRGGGKAA